MTILLDAYAARTCPVKTQNRYDPTVPEPSMRDDQTMVEIFLGSQTFKDEVLSQLVAACADVVDLRNLDDGADRVGLTLQAMADGAAVVLGPRLPVDEKGHRRGSPDLVVRAGQTGDGRPGFLPVQIKRHKVLEKRVSQPGHLRLSSLASPGLDSAVEELTLHVRSNREGDLIQIAHYWRMLEAAGHAPAGPPMAGLIGTDELDQQHRIAWVDLTVKTLRTFSRTASGGWRLRSPLERYDHEFSFRVTVANRATSALPDQPAAMVTPIRIRECESCPWWERCAPTLAEDDLSLRIDKAPLDVREISVLRRLGVATLTDLVEADLDSLLPAYLPEVRHRDRAEERLRLTARRARMLRDGVELQRTSTGDLGLPRADLEIDVDIETAADDSIYLWGFLVDDRRDSIGPYYRAFVSFTHLTEHDETLLAVQAMEWLTQLVAGRDATVYHYSDYELVHLRKVAERSQHPTLLAVLNRRRDLFHDLFVTMRDHYFGVRGLGLKVVATEGAKFAWRDTDPSGLASQGWFAEAVDHPDAGVREAARQRVLDYNEDDVRATHAVRAWLRAN